MTYKADQAEENFLDILMGGGPITKTAVDLDPDVAAALGIQTVSPGMLDELEGSASSPAPTPPRAAATPRSALQAAAPALTDAPGETETAPADGGLDEPPAPDEDETGIEPDLPSRQTHGRLLSNKRAHPIEILEVLSRTYQDDWTDWEPSTLWWALRRDYGPVGDLARNKIGALRIAVSTDTPWQDWDVFEDSGLSWNDVVPIIGTFQPMNPQQTAFAVSILHEIRSDEVFQNEVKAYIAAVLDEHGWVFAPKEYFDDAQELLDRKVWLVGFRQEVMQAWERVKDVDPRSIEWDTKNALDVHLLKLMSVKHYVDSRNAERGKGAGTRPSTPSAVHPPVP